MAEEAMIRKANKWRTLRSRGHLSGNATNQDLGLESQFSQTARCAGVPVFSSISQLSVSPGSIRGSSCRPT